MEFARYSATIVAYIRTRISYFVPTRNAIPIFKFLSRNSTAIDFRLFSIRSTYAHIHLYTSFSRRNIASTYEYTYIIYIYIVHYLRIGTADAYSYLRYILYIRNTRSCTRSLFFECKSQAPLASRRWVEVGRGNENHSSIRIYRIRI